MTWVVKQPVADKFYTFDDGEWGLIELFDGTRTRTEILEEYHRLSWWRHRTDSSSSTTRRCSGRSTSSSSRPRRGTSSSFRNSRTSGNGPPRKGPRASTSSSCSSRSSTRTRFLTRTLRYVRWIWRPPVVAVACLTFVFTISVFATHFDTIWAQTIELYSFLKKPFWDFVQFWVILTGIGAHPRVRRTAYATKMYGGEVHDMGIALLYFTPAFYCDTTDSLLFPSKWQKLTVDGGGDLRRGDPLHDRDGALGRELPRHAPPRAGLQDDALHRGLDDLLQHQPPREDRRLLRPLQPAPRSRSCARSRSAGSAPSSSATSCA